MRYFVLLALVCVSNMVVMGQDENLIFLNNQLVTPATSESKSLQLEWPVNNCDADNGCYAIIQLSQIPDLAQIQELNALGVSLLEYIPNRAYLARYVGPNPVTLPDYIDFVIPIEARNKQAPGLEDSSNGSESSEPQAFIAVPFPGVTTAQLSESLTALGARITRYSSTYLQYETTLENLPEIVLCPRLLYTEPVPGPPLPEGSGARSSGRIGSLNQGPGQGYDGTGVAIAIGDDGRVNHLDMQGRLINHTSYNTGVHGELTVGMAAAAGNIDPTAKGAAPGASVHLYDINPHEHLLQAIANYQLYRTVITSTSYGDGCGDNYQLPTQEIDDQVYQQPVLLHFFSAGNHGTLPCSTPYSMLGPAPDGSYHNTITGGRKTGKNVMAIGNTFNNDLLVSSSSRGPTTDGRLKPDLVIQGQLDKTLGSNDTYQLSSGTSAAAPAAAGAAAGLYQYYRESHNDQDPSSALIKAVMLNTADDLGVSGPDFSYGWGRVNARKSLRSLQLQHYFSNNISHGQSQSFQINIPAGTLRLKAMLYWHDPAGSLLSSKALVNDLDFHVQSSSGQQHLPWIPSHVAHLDSLNRPALPGIDRVNNAEQVVINYPVAGTYSLNIQAFQVPVGPQNYYVVYEIEQEPLTFTYPLGGSTFVPGQQTILAWDAVGNSPSFGLDFSTNNGQSWQTINNFISGQERNYLWTVPNIPTSQLKFRLRRDLSVVLSAGNAVLSATADFTVDYQDGTTALVSWEPVPQATAYLVYRMGERFMEPIGTSSNLSYPVAAVVGDEYWFSVAPIFANGLEGQRAIAQHYEHFGCETNVRLSLQFDQYPAETAWSILDSDGGIRYSGGPYTNAAAFSYVEEVVCLPPGCFTLVVTDAYNDGICCEYGNGWFQLTDTYGSVLANGGDFSSFDYQIFCLEADSTPPFSIQANVVSMPSCAGMANGSASVVASGGSGNYAYYWSNGNTSPTLDNVAAGTYSVTVLDGQQTQTATLILIAPSAITVNTNSVAANCQGGSIQLTIAGGQPPYHVYWSDGIEGMLREGLVAGSYFAVIQDANFCTTTTTIIVEEDSPLQVSLTGQHPSCQENNSGSINATISGGSGNYQLMWSNGEQNTTQLTGLSSGTYSLTLTDGICQQTSSFTLVAPSGFVASLQTKNPSCAGSTDGWISATVQGGTPPFSYQWSANQSGSQLFNLVAGIYQLTLTDAMGCSSVVAAQLSDPAPLQATSTVQNASPSNVGSIELTISGGTAPYYINWNNGALGHSLTNLAEGTYTAQISDQNGCTISTDVIVGFSEPSDPELGYCNSIGANTNYEWIESVSLSNQTHTSGNDGGYGDYTSIPFSAAAATLHTITLSAAYTSTPYREYWKVWIDYNDNQDFSDPGEEVLSIGPEFGTTSGSFIPPSWLTGQSRMRVSMHYGSSPLPCINPSYGEVEDYIIEWTGSNNNAMANFGLFTQPANPDASLRAKEWTAYPNPAQDFIQLDGYCESEEWLSIQVMDSKGAVVWQEEYLTARGHFRNSLDLSSLRPGLHFIKISGAEWSKALRVVVE